MKSVSRKVRTAKNASPGVWPVTYKWIAMGTFVVYTAIGSKTITVAHAQNTPGAVRDSSSRAGTWGLTVRRFDIPAGPLDTVLDAFRNATNLRVEIPNSALLVLTSPGVSGLYTPEQALQHLLQGTGVSYSFTSPGVATLQLRGPDATVEVTGQVETPTSPKYTEPLLDTPQSITVVPRQVMDEQGVATLRDALRNVAGISLAAGEGSSQGDNLTIRGFTARNDLFIDGMRDFGSYYRDPFNLQEVEVLQGPSSVTFGRGSTGGVVNQSSKTPQLSHILSGDADFGTDNTRRVALDFNAPLPQLGSGAAFRVNLMGDMGNVAGRDVAENRRFGVAPSLALGLGTPTRWTFSYFHQTADDIPDYGIPWLFNGPAPVDRNNYYGFKNGNYLRTYDDLGTARVEHDFSRAVTLRSQSRYANYARDVLITEPQILNATSLSVPLSAMTINRNELAANSVETYLDEQLDLTAHFRTGFINHTLVTGVEAGRETSDPVRPKYNQVPTTSLLNPDPDQPFLGIPTPSTNVHTTAVSAAAYALDTMRLGAHWDLTGGIRWDRFGADYRQSVPPVAAFSRVDEMPTWRGALVYKPVARGSIYFDAGDSFNPSAEALALSASTASLPPEKNTTYEFGTKWDVGKLSLRGAMFRTDKENAREPDPNNPLLNVLAGNQRVNGLEFEVRGRLTNRWELNSGYAYLDGRLVSSNYYPAAIGARLANVPAHMFNLWTEYHLPKHWEVGTGGNFASSRTASSTVPLDPITGLVKEVPGYWVFSCMAKHPLSEHIDLQLNVNNLTNRYYYDQLHPGHIVLGPGRAAMIGFKFKF